MVNLGRRLVAGAPALVRNLSTEARAAAAPPPEDRLYRRLSALGRRTGMVASTINEYIREGRTVTKVELERCVNELRKYQRHGDALEIMEWMEFRKFNFKHRNYAVRVDLIAKVKGIEAAEDYFNSLSPAARVHCTYGSLLNCYCREKMTDKALELFTKMVKENMITNALPFNNIMSMYITSGQPEKVLVLGEEMKKNIILDTCTYNLLMNSYAHLNDMEGVERIFEEMKLENGKACNWTSYSNLASIYIKAGYQEKAKLALQSVEREMGPHDREAYHFLITLSAGVSDLDQVHRVWKALKSTMEVMTNRSYLIMLEALGKLNDIEGLTKCYEEWSSECSNYDVKLPSAVIRAYLKHDMAEEAKAVLEKAMGRSTGPFFYVWEQLMSFYLRTGQIKQALRVMETAVAFEGYKTKWSLRSDLLDQFLDCLKQEGDVSSAEEFYKLMKRKNRVDCRVYELLLEVYKAAGETVLDMRARMEEDGVEISSELEPLLAVVCPEE